MRMTQELFARMLQLRSNWSLISSWLFQQTRVMNLLSSVSSVHCFPLKKMEERFRRVCCSLEISLHFVLGWPIALSRTSIPLQALRSSKLKWNSEQFVIKWENIYIKWMLNSDLRCDGRAKEAQWNLVKCKHYPPPSRQKFFLQLHNI